MAAVMFEDNQGCIFLIENQSVSQKTKHIHVHVLFGQEQFDKQTAVPFFCRTDAQHSDGATKNLPLNTFERHNQIIQNGLLLEGVDMEDVQSELAKGNSGVKRPSRSSTGREDVKDPSTNDCNDRKQDVVGVVLGVGILVKDTICHWRL